MEADVWLWILAACAGGVVLVGSVIGLARAWEGRSRRRRIADLKRRSR